MDGFHLARIIRQSPEFKDIPIIAMTEKNNDELRKKCLEAGMNDTIAKPVGVSELSSILSRNLMFDDHPGMEIKDSLENIGQNRSMVRVSGRFPRELPGIDVKNGLAVFSGNAELFRKLLKGFVEDYDRLGAQVSEAVRKNDYEVAKDLVHGLKGVAGNLCANRLFSAAMNLDNALKKKDKDSIFEFLQEFRESLNQLIDSIVHRL